jgi:hypothetical protein
MSETTTTEPGLEARVAELERRLSTAIEWRPEPGNIAEEGLLESYRLGDSSDFDLAPSAEPTGTALHDLGSGALHPTTWPQLLTCLRLLSGDVRVLINDMEEMDGRTETLLEFVSVVDGRFDALEQGMKLGRDLRRTMPA